MDYLCASLTRYLKSFIVVITLREEANFHTVTDFYRYIHGYGNLTLHLAHRKPNKGGPALGLMHLSRPFSIHTFH